MSEIPVDEYFQLREQLKRALGTWHDADSLPVGPTYPILGIIQGGDQPAGLSKVVTILIWKVDRWYTRYVIPGMIGVEEELPANATILEWKELDEDLVGFGLKGEYFNNLVLSGSPVGTRYENVDFVWNTEPIPGTGTETFSVRWTGVLYIPETGGYRFRTISDDGCRLWIDNILVIDDWEVHGPTLKNTSVMDLVQGYVPIRLEHFQDTGSGQITLFEASPASSATLFQVIPITRLFIPGYSP